MNLIVMKSLRISNKTFDDFPDLLTSDIIENLFSERIFGTRKAATHCVKKYKNGGEPLRFMETFSLKRKVRKQKASEYSKAKNKVLFIN